MSIFRRTTRGSADLERVRAEVRRLDEAMRRHDERAKQFEAATAATAATAAEPTSSDPGAELEARLDALGARLDELDGRITSVSTELANQLSELGNELDALNAKPPGEALDEATVDGLRDAQTRLANEQARYQIAFREDLARLAEQLRRTDDTSRRRP
jgi:hypothetical protein